MRWLLYLFSLLIALLLFGLLSLWLVFKQPAVFRVGGEQDHRPD